MEIFYFLREKVIYILLIFNKRACATSEEIFLVHSKVIRDNKATFVRRWVGQFPVLYT